MVKPQSLRFIALLVHLRCIHERLTLTHQRYLKTCMPLE